LQQQKQTIDHQKKKSDKNTNNLHHLDELAILKETATVADITPPALAAEFQSV